MIALVDGIAGPFAGAVDDVVLARADGVPAYNLAVVVDDADQGVTQVVRGDDLLSSTPRQVHLQRLLGLPQPEYLHVPLVLGEDEQRLAKRHGAVTLADLAAAGWSAGDVLGVLAVSLGLGASRRVGDDRVNSSTGSIPSACHAPRCISPTCNDRRRERSRRPGGTDARDRKLLPNCRTKCR